MERYRSKRSPRGCEWAKVRDGERAKSSNRCSKTNKPFFLLSAEPRTILSPTRPLRLALTSVQIAGKHSRFSGVPLKYRKILLAIAGGIFCWLCWTAGPEGSALPELARYRTALLHARGTLARAFTAGIGDLGATFLSQMLRQIVLPVRLGSGLGLSCEESKSCSPRSAQIPQTPVMPTPARCPTNVPS